MGSRSHRVGAADQDLSRPVFSKIMFPPNLVDLWIPEAFKKYLVKDQEARATLNTLCGSWKVTLLKHDGDVYLTHGWEEFVKHHRLAGLEYLVFKYNGKMCFDVEIYDKTGWKRNFGASPGLSFTSRMPHFEYKMNRYNVGSKSTLIIPMQFAREHFQVPRPTHVTLRNPDDQISWRVSMILNRNQSVLSGGWKKFADDNSLKKGDTCIFELVEVDLMEVHIFRSTK